MRPRHRRRDGRDRFRFEVEERVGDDGRNAGDLQAGMAEVVDVPDGSERALPIENRTADVLQVAVLDGAVEAQVNVLVEHLLDVLQRVHADRRRVLRVGRDFLARREHRQQHLILLPNAQLLGEPRARFGDLRVPQDVVVLTLHHARQRHLRVAVVVGIGDADPRQPRVESRFLHQMVLLLYNHEVRVVAAVETVHIIHEEVIAVLHVDVDVRLLDGELRVVEVVELPRRNRRDVVPVVADVSEGRADVQNVLALPRGVPRRPDKRVAAGVLIVGH